MKIMRNMIQPEVAKLIYDCYKSGLRFENHNGKLFFKGSSQVVIDKIVELIEKKDQIVELLMEKDVEDKLYQLVKNEDFDAADLADLYLIWKSSPSMAQNLVEKCLGTLQVM